MPFGCQHRQYMATKADMRGVALCDHFRLKRPYVGARSLICHPSQRASTRRRVPHCWLGCMDPGHAPGAGTLLLLSGRHFLGHSSVSRQIQIQPTTTHTTTHATYKGGAAILSIVRWAALRAIGLCWEDSLYRLFGPQVSSGPPCKSDKTLHADADRPVFPLCK